MSPRLAICLGIVAAFALAGCAHENAAPPPPPPPPPPVSAEPSPPPPPQAAPSATNAYVTLRLAFADDPASFYRRPHGVVLLIAGQDAINRKLCNATKSQLGVGTGSNIPANEVPTFWFDKRHRALGRDAPDVSCDEMIQNYDYQKAHDIILVLNHQCHCMNVEGPILVGYSSATTKVFDITLSSVHDQYRMDQVMAIWCEQVSHNPAYWDRHAFRVVMLRNEFQNIAELVGRIVRL